MWLQEQGSKDIPVLGPWRSGPLRELPDVQTMEPVGGHSVVLLGPPHSPQVAWMVSLPHFPEALALSHINKTAASLLPRAREGLRTKSENAGTCILHARLTPGLQVLSPVFITSMLAP